MTVEEVAHTDMALADSSLTTEELSADSERSTRVSFVFLWLFTVAIYARPEDIFPVLAPLHLTLILGLCSGLTYIAAKLSGHARFVWSREIGIVLLLTAWY